MKNRDQGTYEGQKMFGRVIEVMRERNAQRAERRAMRALVDVLALRGMALDEAAFVEAVRELYAERINEAGERFADRYGRRRQLVGLERAPTLDDVTSENDNDEDGDPPARWNDDDND